MKQFVYLFLLLTTCGIWQVLSSSIITLTHSSKSSKVVFPLNAPPVQFGAYPYPSNISQVPEARWIWSGYGNDQFCPMTITIQDQVSVSCLMQPLTLYAAADNQFTATFFDQTFYGNNWAKPGSKSIDPRGKVCNGTYKFSITATNTAYANKIACQGGNWAAVIYGVTQNKADVCCDTTGQYYDPSTCQCYPCSKLFDMGCANCSLSSCTTCNSTANFIPDGTKCKCKSDLYVLDITKQECVLCKKFLDNCTNCDSQTKCTNCQVGYKLNPSTNKCQKCQIGCLVCDFNQCFICDTTKDFDLLNIDCVCNQTSTVVIDECRLCDSMMHNCTSCINGTFCTSCIDGSMVNGDSTACVLCPIGCASCQYFSGCITCHSGYYLNNDSYVLCISRCGDGLLVSLQGQECDDGNILNGDGCNEHCQIQSNYQCDTKQNQLSNCSYSAVFRLFVKWVKKQYYMNRVNISIMIKPNIQSLSFLNFLQAFQIESPNFFDYEYHYDPNGTVYISYYYDQTLEGQYYWFIFSPSKVSSLMKYTPSSSLLVEMTTMSNIPITHYQQAEVYSFSQTLQKSVLICIYFYYFLAFIGLFVNKIITISLVSLWQISFLSIGVVDKVIPFLSTLFKADIITGYNLIEPTDNRYVPNRINAINYSNNISQNLNLHSLILLAAAFIFPFIFGIFSIAKNKLSSKTKTKSIIHKIKISLLAQFLLSSPFYIVIFFITNIGFSCGLQILYGQFNILNLFILFSSIVLLFAAQLTFKNSNTLHYGEFYSLLKPNTQSQLYFSFDIIFRFLLGFILSLFNESIYVPIYSLFLCIIFLVYQLSVIPFKKPSHNYLIIIGHFSVVVILTMRMFYRSMKNQYPIEIISKIFEPAYIQIGLMIVNMLITMLILFVQISFKIKSKKLLQQTQDKNKQQHILKTETYDNNTIINRKESYQIKDQEVHIYII